MLQYVKPGNLLEAPEKIIVHGCNAQGVMASGIAKAVREKWPEAYKRYKADYEWYNNADNGIKLGYCSVAQTDGKYIVNGITQEFYGRDPKVVYVNYGAIEKVMYGVRMLANQIGENAVAMPKIGAGLGNGDWRIIEGILQRVFQGPTITAKVYVIE